MDNLKREERIALEEYGMEGEVVMTKPSLRKKTDLKNALGRYSRCHKDEQGKAVVDEVDFGFMEMAEVLSYVSKSPFQQTVKGFLDYSDRMDAKEQGSAERLYDRMCEIAKGLGSESPFAESPSQVTGSSE